MNVIQDETTPATAFLDWIEKNGCQIKLTGSEGRIRATLIGPFYDNYGHETVELGNFKSTGVNKEIAVEELKKSLSGSRYYIRKPGFWENFVACIDGQKNFIAYFPIFR